MMFIHADDTRTHRFPKGWHPIAYEPYYLCDQEVWMLTTDQAEWDIDYIESLAYDDPELIELLSDKAPVSLGAEPPAAGSTTIAAKRAVNE